MPYSAHSDHCAAVIPCLDEGRTIAGLVSEVREYFRCVIVVDDGSRDDTGEAARQAGATVLRRAGSGGKGSALAAGFQRAEEWGFKWALAMDGDGQHAAKDIPKFLARIERGEARLLVGNRMTEVRSMPRVRRWANQWMSRKLSLYAGCDLPDSQCGFRAVHLDSWNRFEFQAQHFEIESELLIRFIAAGLTVEFVPVETRYAQERSKIRPVRDSLRWLKWWRAIRRELEVKGAAPYLFSKTPDVSRAAAE